MILPDTPARSDLILLGAPDQADEAAVRRAFLAAVKAARPDQGGDPDQYREVIAAYKRLNAAPPPDDLDIQMEVKISAELARTGGRKLVTLPDGRRMRIKIPPDVRGGDVLRLSRQGRTAPGRWGDVNLTLAVAPPVRIRAVPAPPRLEPSTRAKLQRFQDSWAA